MSVLNQTFDKFELIIIDDGSTDASAEEVREDQDQRIRYLLQENKGVSAARNRGVAEAKYDWIAFLDADDEWLPNFLEEMINLKEKYPGCALYGSAHYRVTFNSLLCLSTPMNTLPYGWDGVLENYFDFVDEIIPFNSSSVLISKEALQQVGGFPEELSYWEDTDTWMRLAINHKAAFINLPLTIYHLEAENRSIRMNQKGRIKVIEKWKQMIDQKEIPEKYSHSFDEFRARYQVMIAKSFLFSGKTADAKLVLAEIESPTRYDEIVRKLFHTSKFPPIIIKILLGMRYRFLRYADKISFYLGLN